jgi:hypothetical protein
MAVLLWNEFRSAAESARSLEKKTRRGQLMPPLDGDA